MNHFQLINPILIDVILDHSLFGRGGGGEEASFALYPQTLVLIKDKTLKTVSESSHKIIRGAKIEN